MTTSQFHSGQALSAETYQPIRAMFVHRWGAIMAGGELWLRELIIQLRQQNVAISVALSIDGPLYANLREMGVATHLTELEFLRATPRSALLKSSVGLLHSALRLWGLIIATRTQIVHAFSAEAAEVAYLATRLARAPLTVTVHNCGPFPRFDLMILRCCEQIIAISQAVATDLQMAGIPAQRITLIPSGVTFASRDSGTAGALRQELGLAPTARIIGLIATLESKKAQDVLIAAVPAILARFPDAHILLIGAAHASSPGAPGRYEQQLRQLASDLRVAEHVHFLGYRPAAATFIHQFDVAVLCSRKEALGLAAIEALAAGAPLVATAVEGLKEVVADGNTGLLVPPDDPSALAAAIIRLLADRALGAQLAARGSQAVRERYDAARLAERHCRLYSDLLARSQTFVSGGTI
ncbi:MAG: glycosyltransferase family 4 protein [Chloroflexales bacterium]|nr:glycosyltransferase family 4 protein [Chloroflexales bacterium]